MMHPARPASIDQNGCNDAQEVHAGIAYPKLEKSKTLSEAWENNFYIRHSYRRKKPEEFAKSLWRYCHRFVGNHRNDPQSQDRYHVLWLVQSLSGTYWAQASHHYPRTQYTYHLLAEGQHFAPLPNHQSFDE